MTDELLIEGFLRKNYVVTLGMDQFSDDILILDSFSGYKLAKDQLRNSLIVIFGYPSCLNRVFDNWYINELRKLSEKLMELLSKCRVELGRTDWSVIHETHGKLEPKFLSNYIGDDEVSKNKRVLSVIFNKWYDDKVIEASEKMMNFL